MRPHAVVVGSIRLEKAPPKSSAWAGAAPNCFSLGVLKKTPREILSRPMGNFFGERGDHTPTPLLDLGCCRRSDSNQHFHEEI
jgi:hypothetical protein